MAVDVRADAVARHALHGIGEVLGRDVQALGVISDLTLRPANACGEQLHQLLHDIGRAVGMRIGGVALSVRLEDVVHHRQAEAPHQFAVEQQVAVVHAVAQAVEVCQQDGSLLIR